MRCARIKADGSGYYHCMSRIIERRLIMQYDETVRFLTLMYKLAAFSGLEILSYACMSNHFHILAYVPERKEVTDEELFRRLGFIYSEDEVDFIRSQLQDYRLQGLEYAAEILKKRFTYRMYDISEYFKSLKQQFSQHYNRQAGRRGPLWEERFKSILVEKSEDALLTIAAYIDLNPYRAGLAKDPKDYPHSSYGGAFRGNEEAQKALCRLMQAAMGGDMPEWSTVQAEYRQRLYIQGLQKGLDPQGQPIRKGFTPEEVEQVLKAGGRLPMHELLRCRIRYFSDGLAFGSQAFVDSIFDRYRDRFGPKRRTGARPMRFGDWPGLCTLRDLRLEPVTRPKLSEA